MSRYQRISKLISDELNPLFLDIENESYRHQVPDGAETHFKVTIVSEKFNELSKVARHRLITKLLAQELSSGLHALSLQLFSPEEWQDSGQKIAESPPCRGGFHS